MKELEVDRAIGVGAVVSGRLVAGGSVGGMGDGMTSRLVGSTVGCWMKVLVVDSAIRIV